MDTFALGHYLYNARRLHKIAAGAATPAPRPNATPAPRPTATPNSWQAQAASTTERNAAQMRQRQAEADFNKQHGVSQNSKAGFQKNNISERIKAQSNPGYQPNFVDYQHPENYSEFNGWSTIRRTPEFAQKALGESLGYTPEPFARDYSPNPDTRAIWQYRNPMNTVADTVMNPKFMLPVLGAQALNLPSDTFENKAITTGINFGINAAGTVAGATAHKWMPALANKTLGATATKIAQSAPWKALGTVGTVANYVGGPLQFAWSNASELSKPQSQLRAELEAEGRAIRGSAPGNKPGQLATRIGNNFLHALPVGVDAVASTLGLVTGNPTPLMFSNGQSVRTARGIADAVGDGALLYGWRDPNNDTRTQNQKIQDDVFWGTLANQNPLEVLAGGETDGMSPQEREVRENAAMPINRDKLRRWNEEIRAKGYTTQQRNQMLQELLQKQPNYFNMTEADAIRYRAQQRRR